MYAERLRKIQNTKPPSTIGQRTALFHMYQALKWDVRGIRDMSFEEASEAIKNAKEYIKNNGFLENENNAFYENYDF
jgi:hypothetical protein